MLKSLKVRLLTNLLLCLTLAWLVTIAVGYLLTAKTLNEQWDARLEQVAESLTQVVISAETTIKISPSAQPSAGDKNSVEFQIWHKEKMISYSEHAPREVLAHTDGYSETSIGEKRWRVFSAQTPQARVAVGEDLEIRAALIRAMVLSTLWPMIIALPLIALLLWASVTVGLRPLAGLTTAIKSQSPEQLTRIDLADVPTEVLPVVDSLNHLIEALAKAFARERQFTDHAAHELRTPLAAIKIQAQLALRSSDEQERSASLLAVNEGVLRAGKMVDQLLTLARLDPENLQITFLPVDFNAVVSQVIARFVPQALSKKIDLGMVDSDECRIAGDANSLDVLLSNLLDNAIRYTPSGGVIDVRLQKSASTVVLTVEDNGPGIAEADRERVFDRFVRLGGGEGSGIGLAIVKKIVKLHHAKIALAKPQESSGLTVRVTFPQAGTRPGTFRPS